VSLKAGKTSYPIAYKQWGKPNAEAYCKGEGFTYGLGYSIEGTSLYKPKLSYKCADEADASTCDLAAEPPSSTPYRLAGVLCLKDACKYLQDDPFFYNTCVGLMLVLHVGQLKRKPTLKINCR
jgi:hypothetical protein